MPAPRRNKLHLTFRQALASLNSELSLDATNRTLHR